jgi:hypothetical protein
MSSDPPAGYANEITSWSHPRPEHAVAGGHRYREARKPELYRDILGAEYRSKLTIAWLPTSSLDE